MAIKKRAATFLGGSPALVILDELCYAYSGTVSVSDSLTPMLAFNTPDKVIKCQFEYHGVLAQIGQNQIRIQVQLNGVSIIDTYIDAPLDHTVFDTPPVIIIPPFTRVTLGMSQASGSDRDMELILTGKVYA